MYYRRAGLAVATLVACVFSTARADTLDMPAPQEQREPAAQPAPAADRPVKGMSMARVARRYGEPRRKLGPVGDPPITRWVYDEYTVYFEDKYVIHSVLNRD